MLSATGNVYDLSEGESLAVEFKHKDRHQDGARIRTEVRPQGQCERSAQCESQSAGSTATPDPNHSLLTPIPSTSRQCLCWNLSIGILSDVDCS